MRVLEYCIAGVCVQLNTHTHPTYGDDWSAMLQSLLALAVLSHALQARRMETASALQGGRRHCLLCFLLNPAAAYRRVALHK